MQRHTASVLRTECQRLKFSLLGVQVLLDALYARVIGREIDKLVRAYGAVRTLRWLPRDVHGGMFGGLETNFKRHRFTWRYVEKRINND